MMMRVSGSTRPLLSRRLRISWRRCEPGRPPESARGRRVGWSSLGRRGEDSLGGVAVLVLVLTVVFGLVQSVEGALQVYVSFKALDMEQAGPG